MRKAGCILASVLVLSILAQAQVAPPRAPSDSGQRAKASPAARQVGPGAMEANPGCCGTAPGAFPGPACAASMQAAGPFMPCVPFGPCAQRWNQGRFLFIKLWAGLVFMAFSVLFAVNILLTVLVSLDMKKRNRFNGLWIPPLLLAGIPVSIIYALFRLGDMLQAQGS